MAGKGSLPKSSEAEAAPADARLDPTATFAKLLEAHMAAGTDPDGKQWTRESLGSAAGVSSRTIGNYLASALPTRLGPYVKLQDCNYLRLLRALGLSRPAQADGKASGGTGTFKAMLDAAHEREDKARASRRGTVRGSVADSSLSVDPQGEFKTQALKVPKGYERIAAVHTTHFRGRTHELAWLRKHLLGGRRLSSAWHEPITSSATVSRAVVIRGMPGMGKTSVAREFAIRAAGDFDHLHELDASDSNSLVDSLAALCVELGWANDQSSREASAHLVLREIAKSRQRWLLILDNAPGPGSILDYRPMGNARVIVTSRWADWSDFGADKLELREIGETEAVDYLLSRSGLSDPEGAYAIYKALGGVPLALNHVAALCGPKGGRSFEECTTHLADVLDRQPPPDGSGTRTAVAATMRLALDVASARCPAVPDVMALLGYCHPNGIPIALLVHCVGEYKLTRSALDELGRLSLVSFESDDPRVALVNVHRLVQEIARQWARDSAAEDVAASRIAGWLLQEFPVKGYEDHETWPACRALVQHALNLWELKGASIAGVDVCELINNVAMYLLGRSEGGADLEKAESLMRDVVAIREPLESTRPWPLALVLSNLALVLHYRGDKNEAMVVCERALQIRERTHDPKLAWSLNNKACLLQDQEDFDGALALLRRALKLTEEADPPETEDELATAHDNIGDVLLDAGRVDEALASFDTALSIRLRYYGTQDHSDVAYSKFHIAKARFQLSDPGEAIRLCNEAIATYGSVLAENHIDSAEVFELLGDIQWSCSEPKEAAKQFRRCLEVLDASLASLHPDAAAPCSKLAAILASSGQFREAANLRSRVVEIKTLSHGKQSVEAVEALLELADTLFLGGRRVEALSTADEATRVLKITPSSLDLMQRAQELVRLCSEKLSETWRRPAR